MLWIIAVVLFVAWLILLLGMKSLGWWLHLVLVVAIIVIIYKLITVRKKK